MKFTKETWKRVIRTFWQACLGYVIAVAPTLNWGAGENLKNTLIGIGCSAIAAGFSALANLENVPKEQGDSLNGEN